jgi:hypothetical protein
MIGRIRNLSMKKLNIFCKYGLRAEPTTSIQVRKQMEKDMEVLYGQCSLIGGNKSHYSDIFNENEAISNMSRNDFLERLLSLLHP